MRAYLDLCERILSEGTDIYNNRTGTSCRTVINADLQYDTSQPMPVLTTRKLNPHVAIAELLGYLKGYDSAEQFRKLGTKTWDANANENKAWLENPNRKGTDDMGRVYGVQGRAWRTPIKSSDSLSLTIKYTDQLQKVVNNLSAGIDDRGEIITFWNPGEFHLGCLRPCLHTHQFSILDDTLHLHSFQRSCDVGLGLAFNMIQCYVLLKLMAHITGLRSGTAYHKIVNAHLYENQLPAIKELVTRNPLSRPELRISEKIQTLDDVKNIATPNHFYVSEHTQHPALKIPFSV